MQGKRVARRRWRAVWTVSGAESLNKKKRKKKEKLWTKTSSVPYQGRQNSRKKSQEATRDLKTRDSQRRAVFRAFFLLQMPLAFLRKEWTKNGRQEDPRERSLASLKEKHPPVRKTRQKRPPRTLQRHCQSVSPSLSFSFSLSARIRTSSSRCQLRLRPPAPPPPSRTSALSPNRPPEQSPHSSRVFFFFLSTPFREEKQHNERARANAT